MTLFQLVCPGCDAKLEPVDAQAVLYCDRCETRTPIERALQRSGSQPVATPAALAQLTHEDHDPLVAGQVKQRRAQLVVGLSMVLITPLSFAAGAWLAPSEDAGMEYLANAVVDEGVRRTFDVRMQVVLARLRANEAAEQAQLDAQRAAQAELDAEKAEHLAEVLDCLLDPKRLDCASGPVHLGAFEVRGELDPLLVEWVVRARIADLRFCATVGKTEHPSLHGLASVEFVIGVTGHVRSVDIEAVTLSERSVERCMQAAIERWQFPSTGVSTSVDFPVELFARG